MKKICKKCSDEFDINQVIDGKKRNLQRRKFCVKCSPFGMHNTSKNPFELEADKKTRARRQRSAKTTRYRKKCKKRLLEMFGGKCEICGYDKVENPRAFAFHHKDPLEKKLRVSDWGKGFNKIVEECKKCQLLCVRCHAEIHDAWDRETEKHPV